jgi:integrase
VPFVEGKALDEVADAAEEAKRRWLTDDLKPATINRRLAILRRVANLAYKHWGWLDQPLGQRVLMLPGERQRETYLSPAQVRKIAAAAKDRRVKRAILLAAMSGLRRGELLALQPEHRRGDALHVPHSKSGKPRLVPLPKEARAIPVPIGLTKDELRQGWDRARAKAGMPGVRFHDLRHTYASWLVQAGAPMMAIRDLLGHASLATTSRYAHLATRHLRAAVRKIAGQARVTNRRKKAA